MVRLNEIEVVTKQAVEDALLSAEYRGRVKGFWLGTVFGICISVMVAIAAFDFLG